LHKFTEGEVQNLYTRNHKTPWTEINTFK
jgi:hypothetical protein